MPILLQISILIIVIISVVHVVYEKGKKQGYELAFDKGKLEGIATGRQQILAEEIVRSERIINNELKSLREMETDISVLFSQRDDLNAKIKNISQ